MLRKIILILFVAFIFQLALSPGMQAQQLPSNCFMPTIWYWPDPIPVGYFVWSPYGQGPYSYYIAAVLAACAPPVPEPRSQCPNCSKPISLASGNTFIEESDVSLPGLGGGLKLRRTWNSTWPATQTTNQVGSFGPKWKSNYDERVYVGADHFVKYATGDGDFWSFGLSSSGPGFSVAAPANVKATLVAGTTTWTLTFQNGEKRLFNIGTGQLTAIIDRNGNTTQLSYDSSSRLVTVTDAASRHLYFAYANSSSLLVTGVSSDVGLSLSYSYDAQGRLAQVTKPDLTTTNFTYNSQSLITQVTDSQGKVLESHTYDSQSRGVTGSLANGVGSVTISYQ